MRVLIVSVQNESETAVGGIVTYYRGLRKWMQGHGCAVETITESTAPWIVKRLTGFIRRILSWGANSDRHVVNCDIRSYWRLYLQLFFRDPPDLIHAQDVISALAAGRAFRWRVPLIVTCHEVDFQSRQLAIRNRTGEENFPRAREFYKDVCEELPNWIFPSEISCKRFEPYLNSASSKRVIRYGLDWTLGNEISPDRSLLKRFAGKKIVANVGHLLPVKNQIFLLETAKHIQDDTIVFILAGEGGDRTMLERTIADWGLQDRVFLLGNCVPVEPTMKAAHLYFHTALEESGPFVVFEAVSVGVPVLALPNGSLPEVLADIPGSLLPVDCTPELAAEKIVSLFHSEALLDDLAHRQLADLRQRYSIETSGQRTLETYREVRENWDFDWPPK